MQRKSIGVLATSVALCALLVATDASAIGRGGGRGGGGRSGGGHGLAVHGAGGHRIGGRSFAGHGHRLGTARG